MSRLFSWEYYCSWFPTQKSEDIDPYLWTCQCGYRWRFGFVSLLRMYLFKSFIHTCPKCQRKSTYRMLSHVVRDVDSDYVKECNRKLER